ncbi:MAG: ATP-binding protein, partial [Gammaproteobacteria bacterium]|nr:ATP-binding protein [Gammaproteobacteria bacterium]
KSIAEKDSFLSTPCEIEQALSFIGEMERELGDLDQYIYQSLTALFTDSMHELDELAEQILKTREVLLAELRQLKEATSVDKNQVRAALARMFRVLRRLGKNVKPQLESVLGPLMPERGLIDEFFKRMFSLYHRLASTAPERVGVVVGFYTLEPIASGETIYSAFENELFAACCTGPDAEPDISALNKASRQLKQQLRVVDIPLAAIVAQHFLDRGNSKISGLKQQHVDVHATFNSALHDTWRAIRFNLEQLMGEFDEVFENANSLSLKEFSDRLHESEQLVLDGLDKAAESFTVVIDNYRVFFQQVQRDLAKESQRALGGVKTQVTRIIELKETPVIEEAYPGSQVGASLQRGLKNVRTSLKEAIEKSAKAIEYLWSELTDFRRRIQSRHSSQEVLLQLTELPTSEEISASTRNLPSIYRRLFSQKPLINQDLLLWFEDQQSQFLDIYHRWEKGSETSVAIVGEEGSGKKTLLSGLEEEIQDKTEIVRITLSERLSSEADVIRLFVSEFDLKDEFDSLDDLVSALQQLPRQVIFVENAHNLLLRTIGIRRAPYAFLYIVLATRSRFLWAISFKYYPWLRLSYLFDAQRYFTHQIRVDFHNKTELRDALLLRQRSSQYPVLFTAEGLDNSKVNALLKKQELGSEPVQRILNELYFDDLFEISGGNMKAALYYWLYSAKYSSDKEHIEISPCVHIDTGFISELDRLYLFTLGEIVSHGEMTAQEHARIFNINPFNSRSRLEYLRHIRLLEPTRFGRNQLPTSYVINPIFYHPVVSYLQVQHLLY